VLQLYAMLKPPPTLAAGRSPNRVRMELPSGGAAGRGNLPASPSPALPLAVLQAQAKTGL
jgi:hypothetical protein